MGLERLASWDHYDRVEANIDDVVGAPGWPEPGELAERLSTTVGSPWQQLSSEQALFLTGRTEKPDIAAAATVGAFGPVAAPVLSELNVATPGPAPVFRNEDVMVRFSSLTGEHVVAQQRVRGAEVVGTRYRVHCGPGGQVAVTGRPLGDLAERDPGPPPQIAPEEAARATRSLFHVPVDVTIGVDRVVFPQGGSAVWAFETRFELTDPPADVRAFLKADDMSLLLSYNVACAAYFGEAMAHRVNPARTPDPVSVRLDGIGPAPDRLIGETIDVRPRKGDRVVNDVRDVRYGPDDPGFDEVSAYYHLTGAIKWVGSVIGTDVFKGPPFTPLRTIVKDPALTGNAVFLPSRGELVFGAGDKPTSRSADFVYHELTHAVADAICRLNRSPTKQAKALSEGYADYVAASAFDDPRFGDWVTGIENGARNCSDPSLRFPADLDGEEHYVGATWAALLWSLHERVGAEVTDVLVLESLQFLGPQSSVDDGRAALVKADQDLFPVTGGGAGRHQDVVEEEFARRKTDAPPPAEAAPSGDAAAPAAP